MQLEVRKYLSDIQKAAELVASFTAGRSLDDYLNDELLQAAVERKFEVIGEAIVCLRKIDEGLVSRVRDHRRIVAFRNILVHRYSQIDHRLVWDIVVTSLPGLRSEVGDLLENS